MQEGGRRFGLSWIFSPFFDAVLPGEGEIGLRKFILDMKENNGRNIPVSSAADAGVEEGENGIRHTEEGDFSLSVNTAKSDNFL